MFPTKEEFEALIKKGKLSEILWSFLTTGKYLIDKPLPKGWTPDDIINKGKPGKLGDGFWYVTPKGTMRDLKWNLYTDEEKKTVLNSGNYFQTELQAQRAFEKVITLLVSLH
jgi:hypothetical protein